jgi:galactokinase
MTTTCADRLAKAGMSPYEAGRKAQLFDRVTHQLSAGDQNEVMQWFVPGRIEVLGKHTDYAGGRSLLCAAERGFCVVAAARDDSVIRINDIVRQQSLEFTISPELAIPPSGWKVFPMVVARRLARNVGGAIQGADIVFASDLPSAAGMSSSSALLTAIFAVLSAVNQLPGRAEFKADIQNVEDLAGYLGCIENGQSYKSLKGDSGVGTFGGSEDHTAILASEPGHLKQYVFCPVRLERTVKLPADCVFVIAVSGVVANKTGAARSEYNRASQAIGTILEIWRSETRSTAQTLADVVAGHADAVDRVRCALDQGGDPTQSQWLRNRFEQFWKESEVIIPRACDALAKNDLNRFGALVDESQAAAERLLENQVPETIWLAKQARRLGAYAASAFGAGFGGSVWALVSQNEAARFADHWRDSYLSSSHQAAAKAEFFITAAGPPLIRL